MQRLESIHCHYATMRCLCLIAVACYTYWFILWSTRSSSVHATSNTSNANDDMNANGKDDDDKATNFNGKIVNGTKAKQGEFPFMVSLRRVSSGSHSCGASLLNKAWALTAAHCVARTKPGQINLQYGSNTLERNATIDQLVNVTDIFVHQGYDPDNKYIHDIALLQLAKPLHFNKRVSNVRLPASGKMIPSHSKVVLIGWGLNATGAVLQSDLQKVKLQVFSDDECSARHGVQLHDSQICAGVPQGGKGQCSGDSGGPLLYNGTIQIGIVSWSRKPCAIAPYPGVYTEVASYVDWIVETINEAEPVASEDDDDRNDIDHEPMSRLQLGDLFIERYRDPLREVEKKQTFID